MKFSANLGFLFTEHALPDAIRASADAGFAAVECHWPYDVPAQDVRDALLETGLPMLGLNTRRGDFAAGENGLLALPGREKDAQSSIIEAFDYARDVSAGAVHLMSGKSEGAEAHQVFLRNLDFALSHVPEGVACLIEPLNAHDAPGYFLRDTQHAADVIHELGSDRLRLMFDCYHVARTEGDILGNFAKHRDIIGHVQFAGVPDRGRPDVGAVDYVPIFQAIEQSGWTTPLGAEYKPGEPTHETLGWMAAYAS